MKISEIRRMRTTYDMTKSMGGIHESVFRSYQVLEKVKEYLRKGYPAEVILELIEVMEETE